MSVFTLEMAMKIIAYGLYSCGPPSYLKDRWNLLDGFIVVIGYEQSGVSPPLHMTTAQASHSNLPYI